MEFREVIRKRFMCRSFEDRDVSEQTVNGVLDAARRFPSAGHTQPQEFIVVRDQGVKDALGRAALDQVFLAEAPVVVAVVSDTHRSAARYGKRGVDFYSVLDGGFASMLVLLAAVDEGLGATFVAALDDDAVAAVSGAPETRPADRTNRYRLLRGGAEPTAPSACGGDRPFRPLRVCLNALTGFAADAPR